MEISDPKIKKTFLYFLKKKKFLLSWEMKLFKNFLSSKNKKKHSEKISYISENGTF